MEGEINFRLKGKVQNGRAMFSPEFHQNPPLEGKERRQTIADYV